MKKVAFVGGGNMAEAILGGLLRRQTVQAGDILVSEKSLERRKYLEQSYQIETAEDNKIAPQQADTLLLAVKPYHLDEVKEELRPYLTSEHTIISILAGKSRERLANALGFPESIVRVMPNLAAQVGRGISAITFPEEMSEERREWVRTILRSVGEVVEVPEPLQDVVTAVSGSGPGFLFYLAQHWIAAGVDQGLDERTARLLVTETMAGAAEVLRQRSDSPEELVRKVATPGGTTEAGLKVLQEANLAQIMKNTVDSATRRSRELNESAG
ncbi:MAG: pyrroline-5-carboxylate reductase [bacterium]